eukprot:jgi/Tetstr1/421253/TSEL_012257.t1
MARSAESPAWTGPARRTPSFVRRRTPDDRRPYASPPVRRRTPGPGCIKLVDGVVLEEPRFDQRLLVGEARAQQRQRETRTTHVSARWATSSGRRTPPPPPPPLVEPSMPLGATTARQWVTGAAALRTRAYPPPSQALSRSPPPAAHHRMSWTCHGESNAHMVSRLREEGILKTQRLADAMLAVDRAAFVSPQSYTRPYEDHAQVIGFGATISAPHMHAYCLEYLEKWLKPGAKVLDVGSGSGYLTAVFAQLVTPGGKAIGIEHIAASWFCWKATAGRGVAAEAPFDCIHVGASADPFPTALFEQLRVGGRLVIPLGPRQGMQSLSLVEKAESGEALRRDIMDVRFVPLTSQQQQQLSGDA